MEAHIGKVDKPRLLNLEKRQVDVFRDEESRTAIRTVKKEIASAVYHDGVVD